MRPCLALAPFIALGLSACLNRNIVPQPDPTGAGSVAQPCEHAENCLQCVSDARCGYCASTAACTSVEEAGTCSGAWIPADPDQDRCPAIPDLPNLEIR